MTQERFVREHKPSWDALETMMRGKAPKHTPFLELIHLHRLYRLAAGHLSYARGHFPEAQICLYLNTLVTRAHHRLHIRRSGGWRAFGRVFSEKLPHMVKNNRSYLFVSIGVFLLFMLYGYLFTLLSPGSAGAFLPEAYLNASGEGIGDWDSALMTSTIMVNNIYVSILAFGLGLTLGLGTLYVLVNNAMMLGALAAVFTARGQDLLFWSLILPHGVWELFAICLSGAAGLRIGYALLRPGQFSRRDALLTAGKQAVSLMSLVCALLVLAAIVEGFFTPSDIPPWSKLLFSGIAFVLLVVYLFVGGRKSAELE